MKKNMAAAVCGAGLKACGKELDIPRPSFCRSREEYLPNVSFTLIFTFLRIGKRMEIIEVVAGAMMSRGSLFLAQRGYEPYKGCWEFPGGKIEPGETPEQALKRELKEKLGVSPEIGRLIGEVTHEYPEFSVHVRLYICPLNRRRLELKEYTKGEWIPSGQLNKYKLLAADQAFVKVLQGICGGIRAVNRLLSRKARSIGTALRRIAREYEEEHRSQGTACILKTLESSNVPGGYNFYTAGSLPAGKSRSELPEKTAWDLLSKMSVSPIALSGWHTVLDLRNQIRPLLMEEVRKLYPDYSKDMIQDAEYSFASYLSRHSSPLDKIVKDWLEAISYEDAKRSLSCNPRYTQALEALSIRDRIREAMLEAIPDRIIDLYPMARALKRHFILHVGPTNSGKTHDACEALKRAESGMYLGPLRLLAYEQYDRLNRAGCPCNLLTGEEKINVDGASHVSSTVEMADLENYHSVVVIDEAQMVSDPSRGGAWTAAILGAVSTRIHVCMAPCALELIERMVELCEDTYEVVEHHRQVPLVMEEKTFLFPQNVEDRDALIVFSKRDAHALAVALQQNDIKCSIIYGDLPYDVRENEARRFSEGETKVVVATDAIGTGLNLPIRRIVFMKGVKFDGTEVRPLEPIEIQQISGRAGRFGIYEKGYVNALPEIQKYIKAGLKAKVSVLTTPFIRFPEHLIYIQGSLSSILEQWNRLLTHEIFNKESIEIQLRLCRLLEKETGDKHLIYRFITIPFNPENPTLFTEWKELFELEKSGTTFDFESYVKRSPIFKISIEKADLQTLELLYRQLDLLHYYMDRFGHEQGFERVSKERKLVSDRIIRILSEQKFLPKVCKICGQPLPWFSNFSMCEDCYFKRFSYDKYFY